MKERRSPHRFRAIRPADDNRRRLSRVAASMLRFVLSGCVLAPGIAAATDVNRATQAELESVRGLGVDLTERILAERSRAPFTDWADVMRRIKGLKHGTAARLSAAGLTVDGASYPEAPAAAASGAR